MTSGLSQATFSEYSGRFSFFCSHHIFCFGQCFQKEKMPSEDISFPSYNHSINVMNYKITQCNLTIVVIHFGGRVFSHRCITCSMFVTFIIQVSATLVKWWHSGIEPSAANRANWELVFCSEECYDICYFFMSLKAGWVGSCIIMSVLNQWVCCSVFVPLLFGHRPLQQIACIVLWYRQHHVTVFTELLHCRITFTFAVDQTALSVILAWAEPNKPQPSRKQGWGGGWMHAAI